MAMANTWSPGKSPAIFLMISMIAGCTSLRLDQADYGWPVESVVTVSSSNRFEEGRYALSCNVARLAVEEFQDSAALKGATLRVLRSADGYYFITGPRFKNVYVFSPATNELALTSKISVSQRGLTNPALNQRPPHIQLVDGDTFSLLLSSDDIVEGKQK
jgi:hypothetical protein